jgi:hypothetical protein
MTKRIVAIFLFGLCIQSCAFIFYNYRGYLETEYTISNNTADTSIRYNVCALIYGLSEKQDLYRRFKSATSDSLYFYGPDYHHFRFKITEDSVSTKIKFKYFGYHGFRRNPPHKKFIQTISDTLKRTFGATQVIIKDVNNEKTKR